MLNVGEKDRDVFLDVCELNKHFLLSLIDNSISN